MGGSYISCALGNALHITAESMNMASVHFKNLLEEIYRYTKISGSHSVEGSDCDMASHRCTLAGGHGRRKMVLEYFGIKFCT